MLLGSKIEIFQVRYEIIQIDLHGYIHLETLHGRPHFAKHSISDDELV
jgi:hypothetical protein